jgi:glycosyltransferase involved in cell wall biosynthesis
MAVALLTTYLPGYRMPLYQRLAEREQLDVLCYGRGERYAAPWFRDLDEQLAAAPFPARRIHGVREAFGAGAEYDAVIAPFAGGAMLPAAYAGARRHRKPFVLWASVWAWPRSLAHDVARPVTRHIYRHADAVIAYGEHVRRFVAGIRGRDSDVFVAPQAVERELFGRPVIADEIDEFRARHGIGPGPLVLYAGRLVPEKGVGVLLDAWAQLDRQAKLVLVGDGPLADRARATPRVRLLGPLPRRELPVAYAASELSVLASVPTRRFREPWGLVCNESMHQARPVVASDAVGAVAGGLVRDGETGVVVPAGDAHALAHAIELLLSDPQLRGRLGAAARAAVSPYTYEAMVGAFDRALATAMRSPWSWR